MKVYWALARLMVTVGVGGGRREAGAMSDFRVRCGGS
jgi:hypothetical protein